MVSIKEILIYPVKGCSGIAVNSWPIEKRGLRFDRQWMLVDPEGRFVSQRDHSALAFFRLKWVDDHFMVGYNGFENCVVLPLPRGTESSISVKIWEHELQAVHLAGVCEDFFNHHLGSNYRLVHLSDSSLRRVDEKYSPSEHYTRFTDGYPVLVLGTASMDYLNAHLAHPLSHDRFRPNLVLETQLPHEEDGWQNLDHAEFKLALVKPCARCVVTTIDQKTGTKSKEPLATLATYRQFDHKINFGMNAVVDCDHSMVQIHVGDSLIPRQKTT